MGKGGGWGFCRRGKHMRTHIKLREEKNPGQSLRTRGPLRHSCRGGDFTSLVLGVDRRHIIHWSKMDGVPRSNHPRQQSVRALWGVGLVERPVPSETRCNGSGDCAEQSPPSKRGIPFFLVGGNKTERQRFGGNTCMGSTVQLVRSS
jgi:hypothetical protein